MTGSPRLMEGPWFEDLEPGAVFDSAPAVTLTAGHAAVHQSIVGDRMHLPLDDRLAAAVVGRSPLAHPALIWDVAIGQSTPVTQHVKANLFYRGLGFWSYPAIGDTVRTRTEVVALRQTSVRPGRPATGLALLRVTTTGQDDHPVLDFLRCAMIPLRDPGGRTGRDDDLDAVAGDVAGPGGIETVPDWDLAPLRERAGASGLEPGDRLQVAGGDVVTSAPELARLTLNIAAVHHDRAAAGSRRLVYGGHTVGIALAQLTRAIPDVATVLGWDSCEHLAPVAEGDTLRSTVEVLGVRPVRMPRGAGRVAWLHSRVDADGSTSGDPGQHGPPRAVLDWRLRVLLP